LGARRDQIVQRRLDQRAVVAATDDDGLAEHVVARDDAVALDALDGRVDLRERAAELDVRLVLVAEAALEAPAHPRELRRVERQALLLRHLDRDRLELLQPRRAAQLPPAGPDAA